MDETFGDEFDRGAQQAREMSLEVERLSRLGEQFSRTMGRAFRDLVLRGKSFGDVLRGLGEQLAKLALQAIAKPIGTAIGQGIGSLFGGGFANGGVFRGGAVVPFAQGGVIAAPTYFPMAGGRVGLMGERGAEAIMPLARGPDGRLGVRAAGGGRAAQVTVNISTPDVEGFRRSQGQIAALLSRTVAQGQRNL